MSALLESLLSPAQRAAACKADTLAHYRAMADEATWGQCVNHPNDPRTEEAGEAVAGLLYLIEDAENMLGRATRAIVNGDIDAAIDMLKSAGADLSGACWS